MQPHSRLKQYWRKRRYSRYSKHLNLHFFHRFGLLLLFLLLLICMHTLAMVLFESLSVGDALWLSLTTITTVGYGDLSAATTAGRVSSTLFIYSVGITMLAQLGAEYMEYRLTIRDKKLTGRWRWKKMQDHIVIINTPERDAGNYLEQLVAQIRQTPQLRELPVQLLTEQFDTGLPESLTELGVVHYCGSGHRQQDLQSVNIDRARYVLALAKERNAELSDSLCFDLLSRIKAFDSDALILAEVCRDENRERIRQMGAHIVVRPLRAYPGFLIRTLVAPGSEAVFENLFTYSDDHMLRIDCEFDGLTWAEIVCRCIKNGFGTPMAYIDDRGVEVHPMPDKICRGHALITMINDAQHVSAKLLRACLQNREVA